MTDDDLRGARVSELRFTVRALTKGGTVEREFVGLPALLDWLQAQEFPADEVVAEWLAGRPVGRRAAREERDS